MKKQNRYIQLFAFIYFFIVLILKFANIIEAIPLIINYISLGVSIYLVHLKNLEMLSEKKQRKTIKGIFIIIIIAYGCMLAIFDQLGNLTSNISDIFSLLALLFAVSTDIVSLICILPIKYFIPARPYQTKKV